MAVPFYLSFSQDILEILADMPHYSELLLSAKRDGFTDILFSGWTPTEPMRLFMNKGNGAFEDFTHESSSAYGSRPGTFGRATGVHFQHLPDTKP